jgi:hypothetical protein
MIDVMKKILSILVFLCLLSAPFLFSEEIEIDSEVINVDHEMEFFIIRAGENSGIEIGDGLIVHRAGEKIAEAYIIEVRPEVSAAEILDLQDYKEVQEGDDILIVKETVSSYGTAKKSKWTNVLGLDPGMRTESGVRVTSEKEATYVTSPGISEIGISEKVAVISISIDEEPNRVFSYVRMVLKENGYSITSSSRAAGILLAVKPIELSLISELLAYSHAAIDHNIVVSFGIKLDGDSSRLVVSSFKEHFQKGKHVKRAVDKDSKYYGELVKLVSEIKERSEY